MSSTDPNVIVGGSYEGYHITSTSWNGYDLAYIKENGKEFSKDNVKSFEVINNNAGDGSLKGAILGGVAGAIVGASMTDMLVKVQWQSGGESLVKVTAGMYNAMVTTSYHPSRTSEEIQKDKESTQLFYLVGIPLVALIWFIIYLVGSC